MMYDIAPLINYLRKVQKRQAKKKPKGDAQRIHARKRAAERFGLPPKSIKYMERQIRHWESTFVCACSNRESKHICTYEGNQYLVIYDRHRKNIVTVLPAEELQKVLEQEKER